MKPVIETHDLCKSYNGRTVVDHLNLTVPQGCVYGFLGPNGAGKSTSMKMLLGLVHPTGGSVELLGHTMNETNRIPLLRQTGSLIESPSGYLHLTARENLAIVADLKGVAHKDIDRVLEIVHLTADANRKVGQYSLGMKQRLGIAQAVLNDPSVLVLDEPTAGLDPKERVRFRNLISSLAQDKIVILSTHIVSDVEYIADEILVMRAGGIITTGTVDEITGDIRGCVWECTVAPREADAMSASLTVGNIHYAQDGSAIVRVVAQQRPHPSARAVEPTLEDVYLYLFQEQSGGLPVSRTKAEAGRDAIARRKGARRG